MMKFWEEIVVLVICSVSSFTTAVDVDKKDQLASRSVNRRRCRTIEERNKQFFLCMARGFDLRVSRESVIHFQKIVAGYIYISASLK